MQVPFVTTVSFADRDGTAVHLQYGVSAGNEREARSELERRLINQELFNYSILEIRRRHPPKPLPSTCWPAPSSC